MSSTSTTLYEVNVYADDRWHNMMTGYSKKDALAMAETLQKESKKWSVVKRTERVEVIGSG